jgi:hypothetical protein
MTIAHANTHPSVVAAQAEYQRIEALRQSAQTNVDLARRRIDEPDSQPAANILAAAVLAGGDGTEKVAHTPDERVEALHAAEERLHALTAASRTAFQRVEHARSTAGADIAAQLGLSLETHRERMRAAVEALHALCVDSQDLLGYVEEQGYRIPVGAIPLFSLYGWSALETCDVLEGWLKQNAA